MRRFLEMETSYHSIAGLTFIVLDELHRSNLFHKILFRERLEEIASAVAEYAWLDDYHTRNFCLNYIHIS